MKPSSLKLLPPSAACANTKNAFPTSRLAFLGGLQPKILGFWAVPTEGRSSYQQRPRGASAGPASGLALFTVVEVPRRAAGRERYIPVLFDGSARTRHEVQEVFQVVQGVEPHCQYFFGDEKVAQIGAGEMQAGVAGAARIERPIVSGVGSVLDDDLALRGEEQPVARASGGQDTVEHVDARAEADGLSHRLPVLPHGKPTQRIAGKIHRADFLHVPPTKLPIHASLDDSE